MKSLSRVQLFATPWTVAYQVPSSVGFSRQEYWSGLPFPSPEDLPHPGIEPRSPALQADALSSEPPGKQVNLAANLPFPTGCRLVHFTLWVVHGLVNVVGQHSLFFFFLIEETSGDEISEHIALVWKWVHRLRYFWNRAFVFSISAGRKNEGNIHHQETIS